jgi:hypothetical protein
MIDAKYLRQWARRCYSLAQVTTDPEVRYQLQAWATEFERDANELERGGSERGGPGDPA